MSTHSANRDISSLVQPHNLAEVVFNGRGVRAEEVAGLRNEPTTLRELAASAALESAAKLYGFLRQDTADVRPDNVFHFYIPRDATGVLKAEDMAYPPLPVHVEATKYVKDNASQAHDAFRAAELGAVITAAIGAKIGEPDAILRGFVDADHMPEWVAAPDAASRTPEEHQVYDLLLNGTGQQYVGPAVPPRAPIAAVVFGQIGSAGVAELSGTAQRIRAEHMAHQEPDPFSQEHVATELIDTVRERITNEAFNVIIRMLCRNAVRFQDHPDANVVPGRHARLASLLVTD